MQYNSKVHLVGSIPGDDAESVFRASASGLGETVLSFPDGETGVRRVWVVYLAHHVFDQHPGIEDVVRPKPVGSIEKEWRTPEEHWVPSAFDDMWLFKVRDGVESIRIDKLGYADEAIASYKVFKRLKDEGVIGAEQRFMVCLPLPESATRWFVQDRRDYDIITPAVQAALVADLNRIIAEIPSEELTIQWDVCMEVLATAVGDTLGRPPMAWPLPDTPIERYEQVLAELCPLIPANVPVGLHLCYGDLGHVHLVEPDDLGICVEMANRGKTAAGRSIEFVHMPVPRDRSDDAYFAPLAALNLDGTRLFLGLVHHTDGAEGGRKRVAAAKRALDDFGIATECGFGRRPADQIPELMAIHQELAALL